MAREDPDLTGVPDSLCPALFACLHKTPETRPSSKVLATALDLADTADRPANRWLPDAYLHEVGVVFDSMRRLAGRRYFRK